MALSSRLDYTHKSLKQILLSDKMKSPSTAELEEICLRALEKFPGHRYAHAGEMAEALGRLFAKVKALGKQLVSQRCP